MLFISLYCLMHQTDLDYFILLVIIWLPLNFFNSVTLGVNLLLCFFLTMTNQ